MANTALDCPAMSAPPSDMSASASKPPPSLAPLPVAVVMERVAAPNAWERWQFRLLEVVPDEGAFGDAPRCLVDDGKVSRWLFPGHKVALVRDGSKGYYLNLTSGRPSWFVSWVVDEGDGGDDGNRSNAGDGLLPTLTGVSLSYVEADRRMASEEHVETLPLPAELCEWLRQFTNAHFHPETRRKVRAQSFLSPQERERMAAGAGPSADANASAPAPPVAPTTLGADRNAELRALFHSDPHFRRSDGLEVGDAEVHAIEGTPSGRQRKIQQARELGLLDDELLDQDPPPAADRDPPR